MPRFPRTRPHSRPRRTGHPRLLLPLMLAVSLLLTAYALDAPLAPNVLPDPLALAPTQFLVSSAPESPPTLSSRYALLIDRSSQRVLYEKGSQERIYPASMTKVMTALVALSYLDGLSEPIALDGGLFDPLYQAGASLAGFVPGEKVSALDLIYGVLLPSGAECCLALAQAVAGSESAFVSLMNERAQALGMQNTHFVNSTGLHHPDHYTTCQDLALLMDCALQDELFREVFTARKWVIEPTPQHPEGITLRSSLFEKLAQLDAGETEILGGKTGYTAKAGQCLISLAQKDGREYLAITAKAPGTSRGKAHSVLDALALFDWCASQP